MSAESRGVSDSLIVREILTEAKILWAATRGKVAFDRKKLKRSKTDKLNG
jgi:hypothetical protein